VALPFPTLSNTIFEEVKISIVFIFKIRTCFLQLFSTYVSVIELFKFPPLYRNHDFEFSVLGLYIVEVMNVSAINDGERIMEVRIIKLLLLLNI